MSLNKLGIKVDFIGLLYDLERKLKFTVENIVDEIVAELNANDFEFASGTFKRELIETSEDYIKYRVGSSHWYSFIVNYGKGSDMDMNNPFLKSYMADKELWNPSRKQDPHIVTRPKKSSGEPYEVPNWEKGKGLKPVWGSANGGYNLEATGNPEYQPKPPKHYLNKAIGRAKERLIIAIDDVFKTFPYSDYLKGGD